MLVALFMLLSFTPPAFAGGDDPVPVDPAVSQSQRQSEYKRLSVEMDTLAKKTAWAGVERTFQRMIETGVDPTFDDLRTAATASQALGDIQGTFSRLNQARELQEDKELFEWIWALERAYGRVLLAGNPGKVTFAAKVIPFDPTQAKVVQFAQKSIEETGVFEGWLPVGEYTFGGVEILVKDSNTSRRTVDLRTDEGVRKSERKKKKRETKGSD
ncbi:MAG: hypothetical protein AB8H79_09535 [Myxococcota bacterium]